MNERLRAHIEELFKNAPKTLQTVEIKEEILQNTVDRYNDLLAEGKSEEAAFNIAVAGIGDVEGLIASLMAPRAMSGYTKEEIEQNRRRRSVLMSISIMLYICSVIPVIISEEVFNNDVAGVVIMFVMVAAATAIIVYRSGVKLHYAESDGTVVEDFKEWNQKSKEEKSVLNAVNGAVWSLTLVAYFLLSFITGAWYITWLVFFIGGAVVNIIKAIRDLIR